MKRIVALLLTLLLLTGSLAHASVPATTTTRLATRSGPGTQYTEPGTFLSAGHSVVVHTKAYDSRNGIWWVQVEFSSGGRIYRAYTGAQRLNVNLNQVPEETVLEYTYLIDNGYGYAGPGYGHAYYSDWYLVRETNCRVMEVENGFALIDTASSWPSQNVRVWVPIDMLAGGGKYYGEDTYPDNTSGSYGGGSSSYGRYPIGEWCCIIASSANVRAGAGTQYGIVGYVKENQWYEIIDCKVGSTGKVWFRIFVDGEYGWISSGVTNMEQ